jgi:DNA polymerase-1
MIRMDDALRAANLDARMLLQVHDELVFEAPEGVSEQARALIVERMEAAMDLSVPLRVDSAISQSWYDGK